MKDLKIELSTLLKEYSEVHHGLNVLEKQIVQQMSIHNDLKNKLDSIREREKQIINNIEQETGEKLNITDYI
jgi:archaellum component FlaC